MTQLESNLPTDLSAPAKRALAEAGYLRLEQLSHVSEAKLKKLHGIGPKSIKQLRQALGSLGLAFAIDEPHRADKQNEQKKPACEATLQAGGVVEMRES